MGIGHLQNSVPVVPLCHSHEMMARYDYEALQISSSTVQLVWPHTPLFVHSLVVPEASVVVTPRSFEPTALPCPAHHHEP